MFCYAILQFFRHNLKQAFRKNKQISAQLAALMKYLFTVVVNGAERREKFESSRHRG